jgi:hypothetical protein
MAYKVAKGKVNRADIYNQDDAQGNTYLDWSEDALGIVAGGTTVFVVSGSTPLVGVGTDSPDYTLDVAGNVGVNEYIYHNDDTDTYIRFQGDKISLFAGNKNMLKLEEATNDKVLVNPAGVDIDFRVNGENVTDLFNTDALNDRVGVGTDSGNSTFEVSGSQAGNYTQFTGSAAFNETHYIVDYTGNGAATFTLPDVSGITGRTYHIISHNQHETAALTITGSGGQFQGPNLDNDSDSIDIDGWTPQSVTVVSTGGNWFILVDNRSQGPG